MKTYTWVDDISEKPCYSSCLIGLGDKLAKLYNAEYPFWHLINHIHTWSIG